jgi:hypothetical protein
LLMAGFAPSQSVSQLVGGFKDVLFSISYLGCHPSHWRTPSFFKMVC